MFKSKFYISFKIFLFIKEWQSQKTEEKNPCIILENYPMNMKIRGAHLQIVSNECTHFQKSRCTHILEHAWTKSCPHTGTDRQTDGVCGVKNPNRLHS